MLQIQLAEIWCMQQKFQHEWPKLVAEISCNEMAEISCIGGLRRKMGKNPKNKGQIKKTKIALISGNKIVHFKPLSQKMKLPFKYTNW